MSLDAAFWPALWDLAIAERVRPEVLLCVWWAESSLDPAAQNQIGCIGLNQSCPRSIGGPGFPTADPSTYKGWAASAQLAWIHPQIAGAIALDGGRPFRSAARYRQATFLPGSLPKARGPNDTIAAGDGPYATQYRGNVGLDFDHDGRITLQDIGDQLYDAIAKRGGYLRGVIAEAYRHAPAGAPWTEPLSMEATVYEPGSALPVGGAPAPRRRGPGAAGLFVAFLLGGMGLAWGSSRGRR